MRTPHGVLTHSYIHMYATGEPLIPAYEVYHIFVNILCALVCSAWYLVPGTWYPPVFLLRLEPLPRI